MSIKGICTVDELLCYTVYRGDDKRLEELISQLRRAEMTLLILKQEQDSIDVHLQLARSHLEKMQQVSEVNILSKSMLHLVPSSHSSFQPAVLPSTRSSDPPLLTLCHVKFLSHPVILDSCMEEMRMATWS